LVEPVADDIRVRRALNQAEVLRGFAETRYAAKSWGQERRVVARIEASASHADDMLRRGIDIRYVVTSLQESDAEHLYETVYCARGQAENLIKQHKAQLSSDRTSCRSALANQMRLILHTGAYCCSTCAPRSRVGIRSSTQSSPPSVCVYSRSPAASSRPQAAFASRSPHAARRPRRSVSSRSSCNHLERPPKIGVQTIPSRA
jgi:hypothetical protein